FCRRVVWIPDFLPERKENMEAPLVQPFGMPQGGIIFPPILNRWMAGKSYRGGHGFFRSCFGERTIAAVPAHHQKSAIARIFCKVLGRNTGYSWEAPIFSVTRLCPSRRCYHEDADQGFLTECLHIPLLGMRPRIASARSFSGQTGALQILRQAVYRSQS